MPGSLDSLVKEFEEWKATLPQVKIRRSAWLMKKYRIDEMEEMPVVSGG